MLLQLLMGLAAAFGIFWTLKEKKIFPAVITMGMVAGIVLVFLLPSTTRTWGFYVYMCFAALAFFYGLTVREKSVWARVIISLMSVTIFAYWLWVLNHWHGNTVLFPIATLLTGLAAIFSKVKLKSELGFLVILAADAVALILEALMKVN